MRHSSVVASLSLAASLFLISPMALAQTNVVLEWVGEAAPLAGNDYTYAINYTISGGGATDVVLSVDVPPNIAVIGIAVPQSAGNPTLAGGCTQVSPGSGPPAFQPWRYQCALTAASIAPQSGSISGTLSLVLRYRNFEFVDDTPLTLSAHFASNEASAHAGLDLAVRAGAVLGLENLSQLGRFSVTPGSYDPDGAGPVASMTGMYYRFPVNWQNYGNARIEPGQIARVPLGANTWLVAHDIEAAGAGQWLVDHTVSSTAALGQTGGVLELEHLPRVGYWGAIDPTTFGFSQSSGTTAVWVTVFIACEHLGPNLNAQTPHDAPFRVEVTGIEDQLPPRPELVHEDDTTIPSTWNGQTPHPYYFDSCGTPGPMGKSSAPEIDAPVGQDVTWYVSYNAPSGDPNRAEAAVVDPIPVQVQLVDAFTETQAYRLSSSFDVLFCRVPALAGQRFDLAALTTPVTGFIATSACRPRTDFIGVGGPLANPPWAIADSTHVVAHASQGWSDLLSADSAARGMLRVSLRITTHLPIDTVSGLVVTNTAHLYGRTSVPRGPFDVSDTVVARGEADPLVRVHPYNAAFTNTATFAPGDTVHFGFNFSRGTGIALKNPRLTIAFPPGIAITSFTAPNLPSRCGDLPGPNGPPTIVTTLDIGDPNDPYDDHYVATIDVLNDEDLYTNGCLAPQEPGHALWVFRATGTVLANYPHVTGNPLTTSVILTVDNVSNVDIPGDGLPANQRQHSVAINVITGKEMRVRLAAGCDLELGPRHVVYEYTMENTAGTHLSEMELVMVVPKVGSPVGNLVSTTFVAITSPGPDEHVDYSTDGINWSSVPPSDLSLVTHLRWSRAQLTAYSSRTIRVVAHAPTVALGQAVHSAANLDSADLLPVPNSDYSPWVAGGCPTTLKVRKFFDIEPLGTYGPGDTLLSGWTFDVAGPTSATRTTAADGAFTLVVLPGNYTITEVLPTFGVTWFSTTGGLTQTVSVELDPVSVEFGNACACDDGNPCTQDVCVAPGVCKSTPRPQGTGCDPENACMLCDNTGACVETTECLDICELQICEPLPIHLVVNGPDGQPAGTVTCRVRGSGEVTCAMNGDVVAIDPTLWCPSE